MPVRSIENIIRRFGGGSVEIIARIKKGDKKTSNAPGREREHFRFAPTSENGGRSAHLTKKWDALYRHPVYRFGPVFLAENEIEKAAEFWQEAHIQSMMLHRCDGEKCVMLRNTETGHMEYFDHLEWEDRPDCPGGCTLRGRLKIVIPELGEVGVCIVDTGSIADYFSLTRSLLWYQDMARRFGLTLMDVPFIVERKEILIPYAADPKQPMKKRRQKHWAVVLSADPTWDAQSYRAIQDRAMAALSQAPIDLDDVNEELLGLPAPKSSKGNGNGKSSISANPDTGEIIDIEFDSPPDDWPTPESPEWQAGEDQEAGIEAMDKPAFCEHVLKMIPYYAKMKDITAAWTAIGDGRKFEDLRKIDLFNELSAYASQQANEEASK